MERGDTPPIYEPDELEPTPSTETEALGLKEVLAMLTEIEAEDAEVLRVIDEVLMEPIPELDDADGWIVFRDKMKAVSDFAKTLDASTARSRLIRERLEARQHELDESS